MNTKLLFVSSLERSGSTLIDLALGTHPQAISLGEAARVIDPHDNDISSVFQRTCSCGKTVADCRIWGPVMREIRAKTNLSLAARYEVLFRHFREVFGADFVAVDSSKFVAASRAVAEVPGVSPLFISLVRDVRGWFTSAKNAERRRREMDPLLFLKPQFGRHWKAYIRHMILRHLPLWLPLEWYVRNRRLERHLKSLKRPVFSVSYEQFVFAPGATMNNVYSEVGLPIVDVDQSVSVTESHIVRGNRMATQVGNKVRIRYDSKWMRSVRTHIATALWPGILRWNMKRVYGSLRVRRRDQQAD